MSHENNNSQNGVGDERRDVSKKVTLCRGLIVHNGMATMRVFSMNSKTTDCYVYGQDGSVLKMTGEEGIALLNELTSTGFDFQGSWGRSLQALCTINVVTNDDGFKVTVNGTIRWCTDHVGFPVNWEVSGDCADDLYNSLRGLLHDWNINYCGKVDLCTEDGKKIDLVSLCGGTNDINVTRNRLGL